MSIFSDVPKIVYEGSGSRSPMSFKFYNESELVSGKSMRDHLKFAMSYWHTLCGNGTDMFGTGTQDKTFGGSSAIDICKRKANAAFELMDKLGINFYCFHDRDIAPEAVTLRETNAMLDEIVSLLESLSKEYGKSTS